MVSTAGVTAGSETPRWQVQQVTFSLPPKFSLLMAFTIWIMRRAIFLRGGASSAQFGLSPPAPVWQSPQQTLRAAEKRPMVPMNSSTGMPLRIWMFLKATSDICWRGIAGAGFCAKALPPNWMSDPPTASATVPLNIHRFEVICDSSISRFDEYESYQNDAGNGGH